MREIRYTFVLQLPEEDELLEAGIEDGLDNVLETVSMVENPAGTTFDLCLYRKVVAE